MSTPERHLSALDPAQVGSAPPVGTVERWCHDFVLSEDRPWKLHPHAAPDPDLEASWEEDPPLRRLAAPGRPADLRVVTRSPRTPRAAALRDPALRARLLHTFLHHELQAAELFAWALLAFPTAPRAFKRGLLGLLGEELGHLALYEGHLQHLGARYGDHPIRDWFWERVPLCREPVQFVALMGLGLEAANLEHCARFAEGFRAAGDLEGARVLERVEREEIGHVAFATEWFRHFAGGLSFETWAAALPAPLTPSLLRGKPLNRGARLAAGLDEEFLVRLEAAPATGRSRGKPQP